ncbi:MAG: ribonuclease HII [Candidatus Hydrogenedentes bacterium]|nr:ribonuclease HII [Candidatus Hydrogenedentota bacterium]
MPKRRETAPDTAAERETLRLHAMLAFERQAAENGFLRVAGVDEAGRGPLAGPLAAAAVVLAFPVPGLNDSKKLTEARREELYETLMGGPHAIGVGVVEAGELDRIGLQPANYAAMARAVAGLSPPPDFLLVDGFALPGVVQPVLRLVKGDQRSLSIAAASIIAKVTRDRRMAVLDARYPQYGFGRHKGYGTADHLAALRRHGPCPEHRRSFAPVGGAPEGGLWPLPPEE